VRGGGRGVGDAGRGDVSARAGPGAVLCPAVIDCASVA